MRYITPEETFYARIFGLFYSTALLNCSHLLLVVTHYVENYVGYKNSEDRISEMDKLECCR